MILLLIVKTKVKARKRVECVIFEQNLYIGFLNLSVCVKIIFVLRSILILLAVNQNTIFEAIHVSSQLFVLSFG